MALPDIRRQDAITAADAAALVETRRFPAELLLSIAWGESRFESATTNAYGRVCGPMQTMARSRADCELMQQVPAYGFAAGVRELQAWARDRRTHGRLDLVLLGFACGNAAFDGTCRKLEYPSWVIHRMRRLQHSTRQDNNFM